MKSKMTGYDLLRLLNAAARKAKLEVQRDCQHKFIEFSNDSQTGRLSVYDFEDGVQLMLFNGMLPEDWTIQIKSEKESPFLLFFNIRGGFTIDHGQADNIVTVAPLGMVMIAHPASRRIKLDFKGEAQAGFIILSLERQLYINHIECLAEEVRKQVVSIFSGETVLKLFDNGAFGLAGAALVQQILEDEKEGLVHCTFAEAKALELFSLQLRRWEEEINGGKPQKPAIRPADVEKIILARNLLLDDLQNAPTIEKLAKKAGVNRQKLKEGFKLVFGKTVNEYLRSERLKTAKRLLTDKQLTVKEIASKVGYENAGYFARRFKKKYGVYPSEYAAAMRENTTPA